MGLLCSLLPACLGVGMFWNYSLPFRLFIPLVSSKSVSVMSDVIILSVFYVDFSLYSFTLQLARI